MSYAVEVIADNSGKFCGNACRYTTHEEAKLAGDELASRWFAVRDTRVVESPDPVNYEFKNGKTSPIV
jgi:hypothetical protein